MSAAQTTDGEVVEARPMTTTTSRASCFEIRCDFVELIDPHGHPHWLTTGQDVPDWVTPERLAELIAADAVFEFRRI